jgi:hypothetical protein
VCDGGAVAVGGRIPPAPLHQERIQVAHRASLDGFQRCVRQGEVEQHQVELVVLASGGDPQVVGFDVAVGLALLLQVLQGPE